MQKLNIRTKLTLLILIILIPLMISHVFQISATYNRFVKNELEANYDFAEAVSLIFSNYLSSIVEDLDEIARTVAEMPPEDIEAINLYLSRKLTFKLLH